MKRLCLLVAILSAPLPVLAGGADLSGPRNRVRGDLRGTAGETDALSFIGEAGSVLKLVVRDGSGGLVPSVRLFGPGGEVAVAGTATDKGLRIAVRLPEDGIYRLEIGGTGTGEYEIDAALAHPRTIRRVLTLGPGNGVHRISFAVPGQARISAVKAAARHGSVRFVSLRGPGNKAVVVQSASTPRGFALRVTGDSGAGVYELAVQGAGLAVISIRLAFARPLLAVADLRDGTEPVPVPSASNGRAGEVLVRLSGGARFDDFAARYGSLVIAELTGTGYARCRVPPGRTEEEFLADLKSDRDVIGAERNLVVAIPEGSQSSLPVLDDNLDEVAMVAQPSFGRIGLPAAQMVTLGQGVLIAVVDTGVDPGHPWLAGRVEPGFDVLGGDPDPREERNYLDDDGDGLFDEGYGHGTFVAGLALAAAPGARILPMRVLDSDALGDSATVALGIVMAVDLGADIVNLSLGSTLPMEVIREAMRYADDRGVPVVVAAGNDADQLLFPARYSLALAVTATDALGIAAPFTNFGSQADLAAPGVDLIGPVPPDAGSPFAWWSGTSFAAPVVSGSLALVMRRFPLLGAHHQVSRLLDAAEDIGTLNPGLDLGEGLVRPDQAVK